MVSPSEPQPGSYHCWTQRGAGSDGAALPRWRRWGFALKPASWPKLLVPFVFGSALGAVSAGGARWGAVAVVLAFTIADGAFIVLTNDWADREVDALKRRMFVTSSPKTIADGVLTSRHVLAGGAVAFVLAALVAAIGGRVLQLPWFAPAGALCLCLFALYSLPPVSLNYRGGGELVEALGVGAALPWLGMYAHTGSVAAPGIELLPGSVALALSSAVASGLGDEQSDRAGGKVTFVTLAGNERARRIVEGSAVAGPLLWIAVAPFSSVAWPAIAIAAAVVLVQVRRVHARGALATTNRFEWQRRYKAALHTAIWSGVLALSGAALVFST